MNSEYAQNSSSVQHFNVFPNLTVWSMNSEYAQNSSRENSIEQRKPMAELKRLNQSNSAPQPQPIQPIVIQCDLPQVMSKLAEQADGINWELEEIRKTLPELKPYIDLTPVQQSLTEMQKSLTEMNRLHGENRKSNSMSKRWEDYDGRHQV